MEAFYRPVGSKPSTHDASTSNTSVKQVPQLPISLFSLVKLLLLPKDKWVDLVDLKLSLALQT